MTFNYPLHLFLTAARFVFWGVVLFGVLPRWLFPASSHSGWGDFLRMAFVTVILVHLLSLAGVYDVFSLSLGYIVVLLGDVSWRLGRFPAAEIQDAWGQVVLTGISAVEFGSDWREGARRALSEARARATAAWPRASALLWIISIGWMVIIAAYINLLEPFTNPAPAPASYFHLGFLKDLDRTELYAGGVYPAGAHALISAVNRFALLEKGLLLRAVDGLAPLVVLWALMAVSNGFGRRWGGALVAAAAFALWPPSGLLPWPAIDSGDRLPLLFGAATLLLSTGAMVRYLSSRAAADAILFAMGTAATTLTHPVLAVLTLVPLAGAFPAAVMSRRTRIGKPRWLVAAFAAGLAIAGVIYAAGFAGGRSVQPETLDLVIGNLGQSWFDLWGFAVRTPPDVSSRLDVFGWIIAIVLCTSAFMGGEGGLARGTAGYTIFGLSILRQSAALNLPELFAPGFLAFVLTPFICLGMGMAFDAAAQLILAVSNRAAPWPRARPTDPPTQLLRTPAYLSLEWVGAVSCAAAIILLALPIQIAAPAKAEYNEAVDALYQIKSSYQPYTWTWISYDEGLPQVLGSGWYLQSQYFVDNYAPETFTYDRDQPQLGLPTPHVFIIVEKFPYASPGTAKSFIRRSAAARALTGWINRYRQTHSNIATFYENEAIAVYLIEQ